MRISREDGRDPRRARQADIARRAGVSQATVSLVLRNAAGARVGRETRRRIIDAARELGYSPDPAARRLAGGRNRIIGIFTYEALFPVSCDDSLHPYLVGIEEEAEASGQDLLLLTSAAAAARSRRVYVDGENKLGLADGAVLLGREETAEDLGRLLDEGYPFVFVGRREAPDGRPVPFVSPDYRSASADVTRWLIDLGHRHLLFVGSRPELPSNEDRLAGIRDGLEESGARLDVAWTPIDRAGPGTVERAGRQGVSAVLTENDAYCAALANGADAGGHPSGRGMSLAVLGAARGDHGFSGFTVPGTEVGRRAVQRLVAMLDGAQPGSELVPCALVDSGTVGPAPVEGPA